MRIPEAYLSMWASCFNEEWMCFNAIPLSLSVDLQKWATNEFSSLFRMLTHSEGSRSTWQSSAHSRFICGYGFALISSSKCISFIHY